MYSAQTLALQYCGGISFIAKIVEALQISGGAEYPTILLDMLGFDGWVAKHCLYQCARGTLII